MPTKRQKDRGPELTEEDVLELEEKLYAAAQSMSMQSFAFKHIEVCVHATVYFFNRLSIHRGDEHLRQRLRLQSGILTIHRGVNGMLQPSNAFKTTHGPKV